MRARELRDERHGHTERLEGPGRALRYFQVKPFRNRDQRPVKTPLQ